MTQSQPAINAPGVVLLMLAAMAGVHVLRYLLPESADIELFSLFAFIPSRYGGAGSEFIDWSAGGLPAAVWSFVTYMLLHGDISHLFFNGLWLLAFGSAVAWRVGTERFVLFTLACGAAGALLHLATHWGEPSPVIGASAAISGHMAAAIRFVFRSAGPFGALGRPGDLLKRAPLASIVETFQERRSLAFLAVWLVINLGLGINSISQEGVSIAWEAHIGGFAFGLLTFGLFDRKAPPPQRPWLRPV